jgi:hypothetical protein
MVRVVLVRVPPHRDHADRRIVISQIAIVIT